MNDTRDIDNLTGREIAVIGMAGRFPGARNLKEFRRNLREGSNRRPFSTTKTCSRPASNPGACGAPIM